MKIKLHRLNGRVFYIDFDEVVCMTARRVQDTDGELVEKGTMIQLAGRQVLSSCKETPDEIAQLVKEAGEAE